MKTSSARCITLLPFTLFLFRGTSRGEDSIMCGDGKHIKIDVAQFSNKYKGSSFVVTLGALNAMSGSLKVEPIQLQQASELVQLWDEFVKSLAIGYNSCAISKEQYAEGITHLYPRLSEDASKPELIRNRIIDNKTPDTETTNGLINDFYQNLKLFADVSGERKKLDYLLSHSRKQDEEISQDTKKIKNLQDQIDELKASFQRTPLQTPTEVKSEIRTKLLDKAQIAENAYNVGYMLLGNGDPTQAIVHFKEAIENVALPAFYLALGRAYVESSDLNKAEEVLRNGLALKGSDNLDTVKLKNDLSHILLAAGDPRDLKEAEKLAFDALTISEAHDGSNSDRVAALSANLGVVYRKQGNLEKAYLYAKRAFDIDEHDKSSKISTNPNAALDANNLAVVLQNTGNFDEAEQYARYSISSYTEIYGSESPELAVPLETLSRILDDKGQHDVALQEIERAIWLA
ncbi:MAG TPA: tetratricopeptide repeat protein [Edaphobacter sp.]|nr:tetratricopeptide repeat protein [Edaphobacter sp.]